MDLKLPHLPSEQPPQVALKKDPLQKEGDKLSSPEKNQRGQKRIDPNDSEAYWKVFGDQ